MNTNLVNFHDLQIGLDELIKNGDLPAISSLPYDSLEIEQGNENKIIIEEGKVKLFYKDTINFYYLFSRIAFYDSKEPMFFDVLTEPKFKDCGVMLDASRNAVPSVEGLKSIIRKMAILGLNMAMLYTEDTYELDAYPYFGYLRGRYSKDELKEIDDYAATFGIELIPCIQTLGHLEKALRWPFANEIKDTSAVLLAEDEKSFAFVKEMIKQSTSLFRSKRVHLGMDEAFGIGLGRYMDIHGYKDMGPILKAHMEKVQEYCRDLGLETMIWSDMPFRAVTKEHIYYIGSDTIEELETKSKNFVPEDLALVYWDYYHNEQSDYEEMIRRHQLFGNKIYFAGGAWNWNGIAANLQKAYHTTDIQMQACDKMNVDSVFCTCWQDNGAETNHFSILPVLARYSFYNYYGRVPSAEEFDSEVVKTLGIAAETYFKLSTFDIVEGVRDKNLDCANTAKYLLYQDPELALFDKNIEHLKGQLNNKYKSLAESLKVDYKELKLRFAQKENKNITDEINLALIKHYIRLAELLSTKAELGLHIRDAYHNAKGQSQETKAKLFIDVIYEIEASIKACKKLKKAARRLWYLTSKKHGYESFDIRLSAVLGRLKTVKEDLEDYISGDLKQIETLEDELLSYNDCEEDKITKQLNENQWHKIVSPNPISC